jgi:hypothetical protein
MPYFEQCFDAVRSFSITDNEKQTMLIRGKTTNQRGQQIGACDAPAQRDTPQPGIEINRHTVDCHSFRLPVRCLKRRIFAQMNYVVQINSEQHVRFIAIR